MTPAAEPVPQQHVPDSTHQPAGDAVATSDFTKRCIRCGKRSKMRVVKDADPIEAFPPFVRLLLRIFSPGGLELNKRYQCPRCGANFNDMSVWEALVAPIMLVGVIILSLVGFLLFIFIYVPRR